MTVVLPGETQADVGSQTDVPVMYEDEWLLVVNKPAGMAVHPSRGHASGTLVQALSAHGLAGGEDFRPGVVHRLDKDTSGLLVVAKSTEAHRRLVSDDAAPGGGPTLPGPGARRFHRRERDDRGARSAGTRCAATL